jgi:hypothetical protein
MKTTLETSEDENYTQNECSSRSFTVGKSTMVSKLQNFPSSPLKRIVTFAQQGLIVVLVESCAFGTCGKLVKMKMNAKQPRHWWIFTLVSSVV